MVPIIFNSDRYTINAFRSISSIRASVYWCKTNNIIILASVVIAACNIKYYNHVENRSHSNRLRTRYTLVFVESSYSAVQSWTVQHIYHRYLYKNIRTFKINVLVLKFTARPAVQVYTRINTLLYLTREYLPQRYHDGHCITVNFPVRYYSDHSRSSGPKSRTFTYPLLGVPIHTVYIGMLRCAHDVAWPRYVRRERDMSSVPTLAHRTPKTIAAYNII